ncbi:hypothetical protein BDV95DRAFT_493453 [Massariosphaeria phaeospora]|uniref:Uncharacterized protein n=1 Tax=Massariosphaeria phaeospora TaxID=100035 RepID=A0A7C8M9N2_9PLEO|nr:hypothetical protein BDV95DRAFT_493453 [Massariosphaeria phaeospora]
MPSIDEGRADSAAESYSDEIRRVVQALKRQRDTWEAVAQQYKTAFQDQTARLNELQDICFATQAELENERTASRQYRAAHSDGGVQCQHVLPAPAAADGGGTGSSSHAYLYDSDWHDTSSGTEPSSCFSQVRRSASQRSYGTALVEVDRLLRGPLPPPSRVDGLLLKSTVLRASDPAAIYDALAACSEALELCHKIADLQTLLPKIQYQRGLCYYRLQNLAKAKEAFAAVGADDALSDQASEYRKSCEQREVSENAFRRAAFETARTATEGWVAEVKVNSKRRRTSTQLKLLAASQSKRLSIPHRWRTHGAD